ncbi:hypothetical protein [uncultured Roseobacter sp.]|uniref:hypothetical protein n=1 Tax=uncultured Roseobacter sp. TaxID=114847 RepID=UPI00261E7FE1|nr:hypothetical protein [uncultured Roseobacter sp.]
MTRKTERPEDFQKFYYAKVGLGEGCGCAERVIDMHEFDRLAGRSGRRLPRLPQRGGFRRFLQKAGLTSRPERPD